MRRLLTMLVCSIVLAGGCATVVTPPPNPRRPVPVLVADYGRHTSLLLPAPFGGMTEYAFGDFDFFALNRDSPLDGLHAILVSSGSALGRRTLNVHPGQKNVTRVIRCKRLLAFPVDEPQARSLEKTLDARFERHRPTIVFNPLTRLYLVRDDERYSLFHNCNHVTAGWLRELGCRVRGPEMTSDFELGIVVMPKRER